MTSENIPNKMNEEVIELFRKYVQDQVTADELNKVLDLFKTGEFELELDFVLNEEIADASSNDEIKINPRENSTLLSRIEKTIKTDIEIKPKRRTVKLFLAKYSAAMFFAATCTLAIYLQNKPIGDISNGKTEFITDIVSGGNKAYLTLADGKRIALTDANNSFLANLKGIDITNVGEELLIYGANKESNKTEIEYNTIEIPRAGQYQLKLDDGTKVWLNSETTLTYPTSFNSLKERRVELKGEAYFQVAHNKDIPFKVLSNNQLIEVLGTEFNLNSYDDEPSITTTLVTGKLKVSSDTEGSEILPAIINSGQQTTFANNKITVTDIDPESAIAWKNEDFIFKNEDFKTAMRKIARWYDVEIVYENSEALKIQPGGWISRKNNISTVLDMIEQTGKVHFKIVGRRVIVKT